MSQEDNRRASSPATLVIVICLVVITGLLIGWQIQCNRAKKLTGEFLDTFEEKPSPGKPLPTIAPPPGHKTRGDKD